MDTRMKRIRQDFENKQLGVDEPFNFHCTMCGKCCIHRDDIILTPRDLFNLARELHLTLGDVFDRYCEWYIGETSRFPVVRLKPRGSVKRCPLLKDRKCLVHRAKPAVCALFPIGRGMTVENGRIDEVTTADIRYFFTNPGCGNGVETHTVKEWLGAFGIPLQDDSFIEWQKCLMKLSLRFRKMEKKPGHDMRVVWDSTLILLYLSYEVGLEFEPQFREHVADLQKLLDKLEED